MAKTIKPDLHIIRFGILSLCHVIFVAYGNILTSLQKTRKKSLARYSL